MPTWQESSIVHVMAPAAPRTLAKVPFVELADGRLQGIVSSGSDLARVYVSSIATRDLAFTCRTNNNRPCGGARGSICKHVQALITGAVLQYGAERVARYLRIEDCDGESGLVTAALSSLPADNQEAVAASVFARFLHELAALDIPASTRPLPEMQWFATTRTEA